MFADSVALKVAEVGEGAVALIALVRGVAGVDPSVSRIGNYTSIHF